jgi:hypothetical protein
MPVARRAITSKQKAKDPAEHAVAAVYLGGVKRTSHRSVERSCTRRFADKPSRIMSRKPYPSWTTTDDLCGHCRDGRRFRPLGCTSLDGRPHHASSIFVPFEELIGWKNVGATVAQYFVVSIEERTV